MSNKTQLALIISLIALVGVSAYAVSREFYFKKTYSELSAKHALDTEELNKNLAERQEALDEINAILSDTQKTVEEKEAGLNDLNAKVKKLDRQNDELEKIIETDKELLQKYSKIYFLNENYTPARLSSLKEKYKIDPTKEIQIHGEVRNFLEDLIDDAEDADVAIRVVSGYRSFDTQAGLKTGYVTRYGTGANAFSADQGYSEHQLGTTVDFSNPTLGASLTTSFDQSKSFAWLKENAYKYGFILSYPSGNAYYQYEPWHWRFVGTELARKLHKSNMNFYDMDQRDINEYLGEIFD